MKTKIDLIKLDPEKVDQEEKTETRDRAEKKEKASPAPSESEEKKVSRIRKSNPFKWIGMGVAGIALLLGGTGMAGYMGYISIPGFSTAHSSPSPPPPSPGTSDAQEIGSLIKLSPLIINLRDERGRSYLKATMVLEIGKKDRVAEVQSRMAELADAAILTLCDKRMEDLMQPDYKGRLKEELATRMNLLFGSPWIRKVYFDEFIYQ